ncbi:MAG: hypothetical protein L0221_16310, partial [Chloroflexi bacterium]|nr:hypothetical protein [Chloroflexota bacterium]
MIDRAGYTFRLPTEVRFGIGAREQAGAAVRRLGRRATLVAGRSYEENPHGREVEASLAAAEVEIV